MIHLELVRDLSATSHRLLKRFVERRGLPKLMLSDNGKTFKADQLKAFSTRNGIIWRFNLAKALGGVDYLNDLSVLLNNV